MKLTVLLVLLSGVFGLFEWVHPEEWKPESHQESIGEKAKEKVGELKEGMVEKAQQAKEVGSTATHQASESLKDLGAGINEGFRNIRK